MFFGNMRVNESFSLHVDHVEAAKRRLEMLKMPRPKKIASPMPSPKSQSVKAEKPTPESVKKNAQGDPYQDCACNGSC